MQPPGHTSKPVDEIPIVHPVFEKLKAACAGHEIEWRIGRDDRIEACLRRAGRFNSKA